MDFLEDQKQFWPKALRKEKNKIGKDWKRRETIIICERYDISLEKPNQQTNF